MSEFPVPRRRSGAALLAGVVTVLSGLGWASIAVWGAVRLDGLENGYYDAGNRFAFLGFWLLLSVCCPIAAGAAFWVARSRGRSILRSAAAGQAGAALTAVPVFLMLV